MQKGVQLFIRLKSIRGKNQGLQDCVVEERDANKAREITMFQCVQKNCANLIRWNIEEMGLPHVQRR